METDNKKLFLEIIDALKKQRKIDRNYCENIAKTFGIDFYDGYNNNLLWKSLVNVLHVLTNTVNDGDSDIQYFISELDFGNLYHDGCIKWKNGDIIDLSTAEKLYEHLTKQ